LLSTIREQLAKAKKNFFSTCIADIYRAIEGDSLVGSFTLIACAIGALAEIAHLSNGSPQVAKAGVGMRDKHDNEKYRDWVSSWIVPRNSHCNPQYLYWIRCALAHTHGVSDSLRAAGFSGYAFTHDEPTKHWNVNGTTPNQILTLNLETLLAELSLATWDFFDTITPLTAVEAAVGKELEDLISLVSMAPTLSERHVDTRTYTQIHSGLARWDLTMTPTIAELESDIVRFYKRRKIASNHGTGPLITFVTEATGGGHSMLPEGGVPTLLAAPTTSSSISLTDNLVDWLVSFLLKFKRTR
jgi:hypothetical protein